LATRKSTGRNPRSSVKYEMRISRRTVDKLGVKLYDSASAVVAELIANSYDADAENVTVQLPLATLLARSNEDGLEDFGHEIRVIDNGHGMTGTEANEHYLKVGRDRRLHSDQGPTSRLKTRRVMGRKGIGKLAPFGICKRIEVISAGGKRTKQGYRVVHFIMDYDKIIGDEDGPVPLEAGDQDGRFRCNTGTTIVLSRFESKRVPNAEVFHRQLARRFGLTSPDFEIHVQDTRNPEQNPETKLSGLSIPLLEGTKVSVDDRPVTFDGQELPVHGWMGLAKDAYKNEEMAGVRIYARGKIVATTRDFEQPAGFTGEHTIRSYLVGEVHAEWLDEDEDLIRTDRQGILWDSEYGRALREWGAFQLREIGAASRKPRRKRVATIFMEKSRLRQRAEEVFDDEEIVQAAIDFGEKIGSFAAEDELDDNEYINGLVEVILAVAPHKALVEAFQEFNRVLAGGGAVDTARLVDIFRKTRVAELASYGQIAVERVDAIERLENVIDAGETEPILQELIQSAPWIIEPTWSVVTMNEALRTFQRRFGAFWRTRHGNDLNIAIDETSKRPDFVAINVGKMLHIVELKAPNHLFDNNDFERLQNYVLAFRDFFAQNSELASEFSRGWRIDLIVDGVDIKDATRNNAFELFVRKREVEQTNWNDFLHRARQANEEFLEIRSAHRSSRTVQRTSTSGKEAKSHSALPPARARRKKLIGGSSKVSRRRRKRKGT